MKSQGIKENNFTSAKLKTKKVFVYYYYSWFNRNCLLKTFDSKKTNILHSFRKDVLLD